MGRPVHFSTAYATADASTSSAYSGSRKALTRKVTSALAATAPANDTFAAPLHHHHRNHAGGNRRHLHPRPPTGRGPTRPDARPMPSPTPAPTTTPMHAPTADAGGA
ncbi:hypothetical protein ACLESO_53290, partial [Pyxidicoccus sp. 3LG]